MEKDNGTTFPYELNQFACWYLIAGIEHYLHFADMDIQCDTLLRELQRAREWDEQHGGYSNSERFDKLEQAILERRAELRREDFYVV